MATDFTLPELGENIATGDVLRVLVKTGDAVAKDQPVLELETDKATTGSIDRWLPRPITVLGTDGYGRSESRAGLRDFFEVDYRYVIVATLAALAREGKIERSVVQQAIAACNINPEKPNPAVS